MPAQMRSPAARQLGDLLRGTRRQSVLALRPLTVTPPTSSRRHASMNSRGAALSALRLPDDYVPPTQPPSARRPEVRKSQLLRTYTSLLRSTPLILMFQHNNLTAVEWAAIRRELNAALASVPSPASALLDKAPVDVAGGVQVQVVRTRIFDVALKVVEFFDPASVPAAANASSGKAVKVYNHDLSKAAWHAVKSATGSEGGVPASSTYAELAPLMIGPLVLVTFPAVSPAHLAAVLSVLAPSPPKFPAPTRKKSPGYYDLITQSGLQKLLLVGGRVDGKVFDTDAIKWVGGIEGGLEGLRAQLVAMLQSAGLGLTTALEGASKSLWLTMESRRSVLDEEQNPSQKEENKA